jgi:E3 ubiquitin-protein ligase HUWE1
MTNPKAVPSNFVAPIDKITELARHPTVELASPEFVITDEMKKVSMSFYRTGKLEGIQHVQVEPNGEDLDFFWKLVNDNEIPSEYHFELLNRIRIANNISDTETRKKLVIIHYAALVIMGKVACMCCV